MCVCIDSDVFLNLNVPVSPGLRFRRLRLRSAQVSCTCRAPENQLNDNKVSVQETPAGQDGD